MKVAASTLGQCFRLLFKEVPAQWQIPVFVALLFITCLLILSHAGMEVWTPLLRLKTRGDNNLQALREENKRLQEENITLKVELQRNPALPPPLEAHVKEISFRPLIEPVQEEGPEKREESSNENPEENYEMIERPSREISEENGDLVEGDQPRLAVESMDWGRPVSGNSVTVQTDANVLSAEVVSVDSLGNLVTEEE